MNLRDYANGHHCMVRLPSVCNGDERTVVLAHFRLSGISGLGLKPPDLLGAWCCSACHRVVDTSKDPNVQLAFAHGVLRTQAALIDAGVVRW